MKPVHLKQIWKRFFSYLEGYDTSDQYKEVEFTMEITLMENSFVGISTNSESKNAFNQPATVKGFIEDDKISFIMKYPCAYFKDENRKIVLNRSSDHPDIHYLGFLDDNKTSANWEMTVYEEKYLDDYLEEVSKFFQGNPEKI